MALLVGCVPIIVALCRAIGPGRATRYAILGVYLLMPRYDPDEKLFGIFTFDKLTVAGLSLLIGVLFFDRKTLSRARPHWVDLPMLLYSISPLLGLLGGARADVTGAIDQSWRNFAEWGIPYALGRLYYADAEGPRRIAIAIVLGACCYIPFCFYEMVMGKGWYLRPLLFKIAYYEPSFRLGGWRPEVMMTSGIELVTWMALSTVLAFWLWACRERWRARYLPAWLPPIALLLTTIACRGIYGYVLVALGLAAIALLLLTRSRWVLAPLLVGPLLYMGLRASGAWDGQELIQIAAFVGDREASSVGFRIEKFEDPFLKEYRDHNLAFGLGGLYMDSYADGWWLMLLMRGGLVTVAAHYVSFLLPAALVLFRKSSRSPSASVEMGLALFIILHMVDSLHNASPVAVTTLAGGALAGSFLSRSRLSRSGQASGVSSRSNAHATYRLADISRAAPDVVDVTGRVGFVLSVACLLYIFGHAQVEGQEGAKFVGGLGSALLFGSVGASVAGFGRRPLSRATAFGLAFAVLGLTFNLALHATSRPIWSADILQGMALSGILVAAWRKVTRGGPLAYAMLAALAACWWAFEPSARPFWGSQYLFSTGVEPGASFPVLPWLALAAIGAALVDVPPSVGLALAVGFGLSATTAWSLGRPFGPPSKFPLNPTYALLGASLVSVSFAASRLVDRSETVRTASGWLGRRWLVFFYVHLGIAFGLARLGLTRPIACWAALATLSMAATWMIFEVGDRIRPVFRRPILWFVLAASTIAVGLVPGLPNGAVLAVAGVAGLLFACRSDELARLILGPPLAEVDPRIRPLDEGGLPSYLAKVAIVIAVLVAPELLGKLPAPIGTGPRPSAESPTLPAESGLNP